MRIFWAFRHVNGDPIQFLGSCWEDGGLVTDDDGNPTADWAGNTIARFGTDAPAAAYWSTLVEAFAGESGIEDWDEYRSWLVNEVGVDDNTADEVLLMTRNNA